MANVDKIKSEISNLGGPALGCQYVFTIVPPMVMMNVERAIDAIKQRDASSLLQLGLAGKLHDKARQISMFAESVSIPGRQLMTTEQRVFGTVRKMPYGVLYDDLTVTFICTNSMMERTFFDVWHQLIISPGSQYMEFYENYVGTIVLQKLSNSHIHHEKKVDKIGKDGKKVTQTIEWDTLDTKQNLATYVVMEAYPVSIQSQELSYSDTEYLKLTVQFAYAKWKSVLDVAFPRNPDLNIESGLTTIKS